MKSLNKTLLWLVAGTIGFILAFTFYVFFLQSHLLSRREFASTFLTWLLLTPLLSLLLSRFLLPRLNEYSPRGKRNWLLLSIFVGLIFTLVTRPPDLILLYPTHTLQIIVPVEDADRTITLEYAKTSLRDIGFGEFTQVGDWQRSDNGLTYTGSEPASLIWSGRTGNSATLVFSVTPTAEDVRAGWDGQLTSLESSWASNGQSQVFYDLKTGSTGGVVARMIVGFTAGFLFLAITLFLASIELKSTKPVKRKKGYWLLYALPMVAMWGIYFLTYFPGFMTLDSIHQWMQVVSLQFNDAHPVFHTLFLWLLTRVWDTPASVVIFQILILSLTIAWGISILDREGLPRWAAWGLTAIFALSPVNGDLVIAIWKDIPYSVSLFLLSLLILKIAFSRGLWLDIRFAWVWLGLVSLCVSIIRHNGFPVPILTLLFLALVYRKWWKEVLGALGLFLGLSVLIRGPIYNMLKVDRTFGSVQQILVHHIAAHVVTGGPLTPREEALARQIIPMDQWRYNCCSNVATMQAVDYSNYKNFQLAEQFNQLFFSLALKEPGVELRHQACISSPVWELPSRCKYDFMIAPESTSWIATNDLGIKQDSKIPVLVPVIRRMLYSLSVPPYDLPFYTPALYLYLGIYCTFFLAFRRKQIQIGLYLFPGGVQSLILLAVSLSTDFRYQYGVYLAGLFSLGMLILALYTPRSSDQNEIKRKHEQG